MNFKILNHTLHVIALLAALLPGAAQAAQDDTPQHPSGTSNSTHATRTALPIKPLDSIVAVVNDDVITRHDLDERYDRAVQQLKTRNIPLPSRAVLEKQLLERMINDRIQLQFASQTGIRVDGPTLDRALNRIAAQNNMNLEQFRTALAKEGMAFNKFRDDIRDEIILQRLREREVDSKINITEAEVDAYLENQAKQGQEDEYNIAHILIRIPEAATTEQIQQQRARAQKVLDELRKGADFAQLSASYSDASNALEGGNMGWRRGSQLPTLFADALARMQPGQISDIIRSSNGFHILKLIDKRGQNAKMVVQQTHVRHILIKTNELVSEDDARNRLLQIRERLLNGAKFEDMARQYSDDSSAAKGGDLGWVSPGETVPEFERAMNALKPGEISQPVQTPFGLHLIQVLARRDQDVTKERQRLLARQALRERKIEEAQQEWLRQLRDSAYVEYRNAE
ncbi:chaperone SurA [Sulfuriferula plumbiphila]|uniref:Chaperone SurA n=1 Tax=Sulfuriferula plumbiphila TaxID=171865 RepID=A0A512L716_9PROT|nr:peptidylprolyl isomerase [Sulfuriferula plumbiphila]BBP02896.1 chaperone SurA [Sulfuriferula plumbiphila]GEP30237.1 chaperone SurA [Sulfuriferula plumbiphila]